VQKAQEISYNAWKANDRACFRRMNGASTYCSRKAAKLAKKKHENL
jgi:5-methylcytosine-specific restriction endonuclease McrA